MILDIRSASTVETIKAHDGTVWSLDLNPDHTILVSGGADKLVKFWNIGVPRRREEEESRSTISLTHTRTLKLANDVLSVRFSPNNKYLAVATLDSTVQIFYQDTLKFYLSLYGHKVSILILHVIRH
jgi:U3 small nucleolar RNA-associated protein 12